MNLSTERSAGSGDRWRAAARWLDERRTADAGLALALGALQTISFVHTGAWLLQWLCIAMLAWRVLQAPPARAALLGAAFGSSWVGAGVWWLFISMHRYGGLAAPVAAAAVLLLALALSAYLALAMAAVAAARRKSIAGIRGLLADCALFTLAWLAAELARGLIFTGFPWVASGYGQIDGPLAGWAPWTGVYGIGAALAWLAAVLAGFDRRGLRTVVPAALVSIVSLALPALIGPGEFTQATGRLRVSLLQTNVPQNEKFVIEHLPATMAWVSQTLQAAKGDLVIAPETAIPLLPDQLAEFDPRYWPRLRDHFRSAGAPAALVGVPLGDLQSGYTNSVLGLDTREPPYRFDKTHLVPFGEFIPTGFRWFTEMMNIPLGDFARGPVNAPSFTVRGERVAPNICYEDLFGEELALRFADAATAPTLLANVSNIGWFGDTIAIDQHLQISRMRTLELQRPMLRATNTGATVIIDHQARVTASLAPFTRAVLQGEVQGRSGRTPYVAWVGSLGLWPVLGLAWALLLGLAWRARRLQEPAA